MACVPIEHQSNKFLRKMSVHKSNEFLLKMSGTTLDSSDGCLSCKAQIPVIGVSVVKLNHSVLPVKYKSTSEEYNSCCIVIANCVA